jgi:hypothetical protein
MMAEGQNGLNRKVVNCWETASKHISTQFKHSPMVTNTHKTIEELLEVV